MAKRALLLLALTMAWLHVQGCSSREDERPRNAGLLPSAIPQAPPQALGPGTAPAAKTAPGRQPGGPTDPFDMSPDGGVLAPPEPVEL